MSTLQYLVWVRTWRQSRVSLGIVDSKTIPQHGLLNNSTVHNNPLDNAVPRDMAPNIVNDDYKGSRPEKHKKGSDKDPLTIILSMVEDAVDDMYYGCTVKMKYKVNNEYLTNETNQELFNKSWVKTKECLENVQKRFKKEKEKYNDLAFEDDHKKAICAYTAKEPQIYDAFNQDVRTQNNQYTATFKYHTLHFWLTDAIRLLKENQQHCYITYRRTKDIYIGRVNDKMRFGYFASSSLDKNSNDKFGEESCFEIFTCFGAYLKSYPGLGNSQKEVLIPPYEVFKITAVSKKEKKNKDNSLWCNTVYKLESHGCQSNLNCNMVPD
ncbi:ecto-ADP-ribosyltransferase 4-like [Esox lucius]|uniref:ecto-ADP-ribosyltransferase 4-like n=1 Tax=Esox lucius TaxID=8010 RepID=UPI001476ABC2|nr:ecto-ADP-ribosyltransferase 4-like [Esox lucius]